MVIVPERNWRWATIAQIAATAMQVAKETARSTRFNARAGPAGRRSCSRVTATWPPSAATFGMARKIDSERTIDTRSLAQVVGAEKR